MSEFINSLYFAGEYSRTLDAKRRLIIPSKWRFSGDDSDNAYLALPNPSGSIVVYPPSMLASLNEKISKAGLSDPNMQRTLINIFRKGERFGCDKQGRISLTEKLMEHAGITRDVVLVAAYNTFHIWDPTRLDKWTNEGDPMDTIEALKSLNL